MKKDHFRSAIWALTALVVCIAIYVWWPAVKRLTGYSLFPLFGLLAFSLMWTHYIAGALRRFLKLPEDTLKHHFRITGYLVLLFILAHPLLLDVQLYIDGFGFPHESIPAVYQSVAERLAILAGVTALICFLFFEFHRYYKNRFWWKYVEWVNITAMGLILWHGFMLGGELRKPWFMIVWIVYGVTLIAAVAYSSYSKRKDMA